MSLTMYIKPWAIDGCIYYMNINKWYSRLKVWGFKTPITSYT